MARIRSSTIVGRTQLSPVHSSSPALQTQALCPNKLALAESWFSEIRCRARLSRSLNCIGALRRQRYRLTGLNCEVKSCLGLDEPSRELASAHAATTGSSSLVEFHSASARSNVELNRFVRAHELACPGSYVNSASTICRDDAYVLGLGRSPRLSAKRARAGRCLLSDRLEGRAASRSLRWSLV